MLKVGDIVRIREDLSYDMEKADLSINGIMLACKGKIATVAEVDTDNIVQLDVDNKDWWWHEDWLEKLNKFSVGDKVVVCYEEPVGLNETLPYKLLELLAIMSDLPKPAEYNGKIGIVISLKENGANIEFEGEEKPIWMPNDWLIEFVHKFKKGDKVRIARSGESLTDCADGWVSSMDKYVGDIVTINKFWSYDNSYSVKENIYGWDSRLLEPVTEEKAEPEYFTGKVVCITDNYRRGITKGRIYDFINGKVLDDEGNSFPCEGFVHNVDELNDYYKRCCGEDAPQFIEIVE